MPIQVRYVGIKQILYGINQLTETTAYQETPNARIGFYNDAFLNNYGDMGTYNTSECTNPVGTADYVFLSNETKYLPMTGETNGINPCDNGFRTTGENAIFEMELTNWTTLNRDYHPDFWNQITANQYDQILKKLGYRFVLNNSTITYNTNGFNLNLNITNQGFARPFKQRNLFLVMKNTTTNAITTYLINTDIRTWENQINISQNFNPELSGIFQLYLWMPDKESVLTSNTDYSIKFANNNIWEATTGYNDLQQSVNLSNLAVDKFSFSNFFSVHPNPSSDIISINFNDSELLDFEIYNSLGQLIKTYKISNNDKIDVTGLSKGIYFIVRKDNKKGVKFIKI